MANLLKFPVVFATVFTPEIFSNFCRNALKSPNISGVVGERGEQSLAWCWHIYVSNYMSSNTADGARLHVRSSIPRRGTRGEPGHCIQLQSSLPPILLCWTCPLRRIHRAMILILIISFHLERSLIQAWQTCVRCIKLTEVGGVAKAREYQILAGGQNTREGGLKVTREEILTTRHLGLLTRDTNVKFSQVKPELSSTKQSGDGQSYPQWTRNLSSVFLPVTGGHN